MWIDLFQTLQSLGWSQYDQWRLGSKIIAADLQQNYRRWGSFVMFGPASLLWAQRRARQSAAHPPFHWLQMRQTCKPNWVVSRPTNFPDTFNWDDCDRWKILTSCLLKTSCGPFWCHRGTTVAEINELERYYNWTWVPYYTIKNAQWWPLFLLERDG